MTPLENLIAREIKQTGAMRFDRFMELALYHPEFGYYCRRDRDPFGKGGDFFTASQVQPTFGDIIGALVGDLRASLGDPEGFRVVELGAGRAEMRPALERFGYTGIEAQDPALPESVTGVFFANEFFDALPVRSGIFAGESYRECVVLEHDESFFAAVGSLLDPTANEYASRYFPEPEDCRRFEIADRAQAWVVRIAAHLLKGWLIVVDYGYTTSESVRFYGGTLISYKDHTADYDLLCDPGERDITSHVCFDALVDAARGAGFDVERFETLAATVTGVLEKHPGFLLSSSHEWRLQLKTILAGMGETMRVLILRKGLSGDELARRAMDTGFAAHCQNKRPRKTEALG